MDLRESLRSILVLATIVAALFVAGCGGDDEEESATGGGSASASAETGWEPAYDKISQESIDFLKSKDWWPLPIGSQPGFSSEPLWTPLGLGERRGLEIEMNYFLSGPEINEAAAAGRLAAGFEGNFPFTSLIVQDLPASVIAVLNPNFPHAMLVPPDSPIQNKDDLKTLGKKPVIGVVTGSSGEFFLQTMLQTLGMDSDDVVLRNLTPPDMLLMPRGLDAVVQWEPYVSEMVSDRKNARVVEKIYPYNFFMGNVWLRQEIIDQAPDVAQALTDMFVEGVLYSRENPDRAKELYRETAIYENFSDTAMDVLIDNVTNRYKPIWMYPFEDFWSQENTRVATFLRETGRIEQEITADHWKDRFDPSFMEATFEKLGWKVPEAPPWIPEDWPGQVGEPPYPDYVTPEDPAQEWPEPDRKSVV
jgi:ABC-type nitrate/sulfonate/bicarbonate transport system substrate-binding protein